MDEGIKDDAVKGIDNKEIDDADSACKEVEWQDADNGETGRIEIRNCNKKKKMESALKVVAFVLIALFSGGVSGMYVANRIASQTYNYSNTSQNGGSGGSDSANAQKASITAINKVAENVGPAVVGIVISGNTSSPLTSDSFSGSGIIFDSTGYIVTNNHVIEGAATISVKLSSGKSLEAKVVGADTRSDLAVIKVDAVNLPVAVLGDSSDVKVGDLAIAIGNPLGEEFAGTVTAGIISALNRTIQYEGSVYKVLQTDAAINPGNSGGALCNSAGEVIGINSLKIGSSENAEGLGFAISINEAKGIIDSLMSTGKVTRPYLGIYGATVVAGNNSVEGVYVKEVVAGSGAYVAGIKPTDIITELDGQKVTEFENISAILDKHKVGDVVTCIIQRAGKTITVNIALSEMEEN
ncbi:MAG TPA: trypsin-like peptidase domain-containing protein [Clostridiaceae bacterium]|nr:trypsin-like peptidase domain-containing protein [Clostridiaceae bacterium]